MARKCKVFSEEEIKRIKKKLEDLPVKTNMYQSRDAVLEMAQQINKLLTIGYSWEEIATLLQTEGMDIKPSTLKSYMKGQGKRAATRTVKNEGKTHDADTKKSEVDTPPPPDDNSSSAKFSLTSDSTEI